MHEMALASSVIEAIEGEAQAQAFTKVSRIVLDVGVLSCVDPHALEFAMQAAVRGTLADGAAVDIRTPPGRARCFQCEDEVDILRRGDGCPVCGSHQLFVVGGEDLKIASLEVL